MKRFFTVFFALCGILLLLVAVNDFFVDAATTKRKQRPEPTGNTQTLREKLNRIRETSPTEKHGNTESDESVLNAPRVVYGDLRASFTGVIGGASWFEWNAAPDCLYRTCGYDFLGGRVVRGTGKTFEVPFVWKKEMENRFGLMAVTAVEMSPWSGRLSGSILEADYPDIFLVDSEGATIAVFGEKDDVEPKDPLSAGYRDTLKYGLRRLPIHLDKDGRQAARRAAAKNPNMKLRIETTKDYWKGMLPNNVRWGVSVWSLSPSSHGIILSREACMRKQNSIATVVNLMNERGQLIDEMFLWHTVIEANKQGRGDETFEDVPSPEWTMRNYPFEQIMRGEYEKGEFSAERVTLKRVKGKGKDTLVIAQK